MPFIVESNRNVREISVVRREGEFSVVRFTDRGGWETRTNCIRKTHFDYEDEYLRREMQKGSGVYRF